MRLQLTTRAQVSGYRFLLRRMDHVLVRRDGRMISDPMAAQARSLICGIVIALVLVGGSGVLALLRPQGAIGDARIVLARESGALFVRVDDVLHPVTDLASARLVAGEAQVPVVVKDRRIAGYPRGPRVGISGAPQQILGPERAWTGGAPEAWSVCDETRLAPADRPGARDEITTTVLTHAPDSGSRSGAVLVGRDDRFQLLFDGRRAPVDLADPLVRRVIGVDEAVARPVGAALLNAFEEVDPVAVPKIADRGAPSALPGIAVGTVVRVSDLDGDRLYVALAHGVQEVGTFAADLVRGGDQSGGAVVPVSAAAVAAVPEVSDLPVADLPASRPRVVSTRDAAVVCAVLTADGMGGGRRMQWLGTSIPAVGPTVAPAAADGAGDGIDAVYLPSGSGEYVVAAEPGGERRDALFYVSDSGVRYGIPDEETAHVLGLSHQPRPVAWEVLRTLPEGPALDRRAALTTHDD